MLKIVGDLGDERANTRPDLPGANSPYAILFHCIGVVNYWMGIVIAGREIKRDREAEFRATGTLAEISRGVGDLKARLREDIRLVRGDQPAAPPPHATPGPIQNQRGEVWTQGRVLIHTYRELAQHLVQMELTRDILLKANPET